MKLLRTLTLMPLVTAISVLILCFGCGELSEPDDGGSEVEKTGFIITTDEQETYSGDSSFEQCPTIEEGSTVLYYYQEWAEDKDIWAEFTFVFIPNPNLPSDRVPDYVIVDETKLEIPMLDYEEDFGDSGPWRIDLDYGSESELTITVNVWSVGWLQRHLTLGGSSGDLLSGSAYLTIKAKGIDGTEQEATNYAILSLTTENDQCEEWLSPSWYQLNFLPQCSNGFDDDGDGDIDDNDGQCASDDDDDESS